MSLNYLFAQPEYVKTENENSFLLIYPIKLKNYEEFSKYAGILYLSKNHFDESVQEYSLFELLFLSHQSLGFSTEDFVTNFCRLFEFVTLTEVRFDEKDGDIGFIVNSNGFINKNNYEEVRAIIMQQNLIHEQKIYKTKLMNEWAMKALKAKQKNAPNITLEDIVSTVSVGCSKHYWDLENYTIYQLYSDFYRLRKMIEYESSIHLISVFGGSNISLQDFAESLDLYHNPYDDLFVSADKLSGLNKVINQ